MIVEIKLFALAKDLAGTPTVAVEIATSAPVTVADLRAALIARVPALEPISRHLIFAIDTQYAANGSLIPPGAEVACLPPMSGG